MRSQVARLFLAILICVGGSSSASNDVDDNVAENIGNYGNVELISRTLISDEELRRVISIVVQAIEPVVRLAVDDGLTLAKREMRENNEGVINKLKGVQFLQEEVSSRLAIHVEGTSKQLETLENILTKEMEKFRSGMLSLKSHVQEVSRHVSNVEKNLFQKMQISSEVLTSMATDLKHVKSSEDRIREEVKMAAGVVQWSANQTQTVIGDKLDLLSLTCIDGQVEVIVPSITPPSPATEEAVPKCPDPFIVLGEGCYHFSGSSTKMTWDEGKSYCESLGGHLLIAETAEENALVVEHLKSSQVQLDSYIGGSDRGQEGDWYWLDPSRPILWYDWASGPQQPDNWEGNEHCLQYNPWHQWNDITCDKSFSVICEM